MTLNMKYLLLSAVLALTACNQPPMQTNTYEEPVPIQQEYDSIDAGDIALGVATGAVVGAIAKSAYDKRKTKQRQVVVVNKYYNNKPVQSYTKKHNSKRK